MFGLLGAYGSLIAKALSSVGSVYYQQEQRKKAQETKKKVEQAANTAYSDQLAQTNVMKKNLAENAFRRKDNLLKQAEQAKAKAYASSVESNVTGGALDNILSDYDRILGENLSEVDRSSYTSLLDLDNQLKGLSASAQTRINQAPSVPDYDMASILNSFNNLYSAYNSLPRSRKRNSSRHKR
ncbi:MAG: hypothetical protein ABW127_09860 [Candidatus Thiodiazotropha endolucinida]